MGKFVIKQAKTGFMFNLKAGNGEVIATSEIYTTLDACKNGIASVQKNAPIAAIEDQTAKDFQTEKNPKFEVYADKRGEPSCGNGQIIAVGEGYKAKASCLNGIRSIVKNAPEAAVVTEE